MREPFLEPILRKLRIRKVLPTIRRYPKCRLLDVGCGWNYSLLKAVEPYIHKGVGVDLKAPNLETPRISVVQAKLFSALPFPDNSFDIVVMLAVLEHLSNSTEIVAEIKRVLDLGGRLILTVPSKRAQPVLEFLAYRLKVVNDLEIRDHKRYWDYADLKEVMHECGLTVEEHRYFQFGMNNFLVAKKSVNAV